MPRSRVSTRGRRATRASSPTRSPTRSTSSRSTCAASRGRSSRSPRPRRRAHEWRQCARHPEHLHRRLRRREPDADLGRQDARARARPGRRTRSRSPTPATSRAIPTSSSPRSTRRGTRRPAKGNDRVHNFLPRVVAGRPEARVHVTARRQLGDLRRQSRRQRPAPPDQSSRERRHADLGAERQPDRVHVGPDRHAADLDHGRRRLRPAADHPRDAGATGRPGRRRRSTRSPTPRRRAAATTSRSSTSPRAA